MSLHADEFACKSGTESRLIAGSHHVCLRESCQKRKPFSWPVDCPYRYISCTLHKVLQSMAMVGQEGCDFYFHDFAQKKNKSEEILTMCLKWNITFSVMHYYAIIKC